MPDYLQLTEEVHRDVRSGKLNAVEGSVARVAAEASRELQDATVNAVAVPVQQAKFASDAVPVAPSSEAMQLTWRDKDGLSGREPFDVLVQAVEDEAPSIASQELPRQAVLLESEQVNFNALAADDFGVKRIGISWRGLGHKREQPSRWRKAALARWPRQEFFAMRCHVLRTNSWYTGSAHRSSFMDGRLSTRSQTRLLGTSYLLCFDGR